MGIINAFQQPSFSIYDASAGSGKTYTLVKEYLKIILTSKKNDAYRNILAITFTNKAVHEMKSRIIHNLYEFSKENPSDKPHNLLKEIAVETEFSTNQLQLKAKQIIKHLIHNYASFDILTIDKFTHRVIRAFSYDLNLPITFEVTLDTETLLLEAVEALISKAGEEDIITNLLLDFTIEKIDDDKSWDITREILEISKLIYSENNREPISLLKDKTITEFTEIKQKITKAKQELESINKELGIRSLETLMSHNIDTKSFSRETFPNHLIAISQGKYNRTNKKFNEVGEILINKAAINKSDIESVLPEILSNLKAVYANFDKIDFYDAFLKNITPLSLLNSVSNELIKIQKDQNLLSIAEFNALIYNEIQNQPAPFIYEKLGEKYYHFFIDEFQDTSLMQWKNLIPLIDNALSSEFYSGVKGSLMIVGDPKQSIYRWRGGKAEQFISLSKGENPFHNPDKKLYHLETNYRSYSEIINFNNQFFAFLSNEFDDLDYQDLYLNHSYQLTNDKIGGYVDLVFLPSKSDEEESFYDDENLSKSELYCEVTLKKIKEIVSKGFEFRDIAILVRKRDHGVQIANYLTENDIPLISSETLLIENSSEVQFILNLLKYLKSQDDVSAKASFLLYIAKKNQSQYEVHDFVFAGMKLAKESEFEGWLIKFDISIKFDNLRKKSLYESVEEIIKVFIANENFHSYVQYFLDIVLERDYHKQAGIDDFLIFWQNNSSKFSIPSPEGSNAIKIMTIHKSKGLEFPVVIIPFADEDYDKRPKDKLWIETNVDEFGLSKALINNTKLVENFGVEAHIVYNKIQQQELLDNINVTYVALTRAEEQLYIISSSIEVKKDGSYPYNMASFFTKYLKEINVYENNKLQYGFGVYQKSSGEKALPSRTKVIASLAKKFDKNNIKIAQNESLLWGTYQQNAIEYGNIIHEILSRVLTKKDIKLAIGDAIERGLITDNHKDAFYDVIIGIVDNENLTNYFSAENKILNEQVIIQKDQKMLKPDRIVITPKNEILLLDYKTGIPAYEHRLQLKNYQSILEKMNYKVIGTTLVYIGEKVELIQL